MHVIMNMRTYIHLNNISTIPIIHSSQKVYCRNLLNVSKRILLNHPWLMLSYGIQICNSPFILPQRLESHCMNVHGEMGCVINVVLDLSSPHATNQVLRQVNTPYLSLRKIAIWLSKNCQKLDTFSQKIAINFLFF